MSCPRSSLVAVLALLAALAEASDGLPRSSPEEQGIASRAVLGFIEAAESKTPGFHSLMIVRHGHVVAEGWWRPYERDDPHNLWSLSKTFTSTAVGLAIAEGRLSLDDTVLSFFPDQAPPAPSDNLKAMRVRDLLTMSTGHHATAIANFTFHRPEAPPTPTFLALPVDHKPGTTFVYSTPATYILSAIVQRATRQTVLDYLRPRLFEPLGIRNPTWWTSVEGVTAGGFGLNLTTEDLARFGQLYLQRGTWNGKSLVPAAWVDAATSRQVSNGSNPKSDWDQGYGFQFWRNRHASYRGDGAYGQFCIVLPEQDSVIAIMSGVADMQAVLDVVWDQLLPAMGPQALPKDEAAAQRLRQKLETLSLPRPNGQATSRLVPPGATGGRLYTLPANEAGFEAVGLETTPGGTRLVLQAGGNRSRIPAGSDWHRGDTLRLGGTTLRPQGGTDQSVATSGAWIDERTFVANLCLYQTAFCATLRLHLDGDELDFEQDGALTFGAAKLTRLRGRLAR